MIIGLNIAVNVIAFVIILLYSISQYFVWFQDSFVLLPCFRECCEVRGAPYKTYVVPFVK